MKHLACALGLMAAVAIAAPVVVARVQDGETGRPLAGAMVLSEGSDVMVATDSSGRCEVVVAPRRDGALVASRSGYLDCTLTDAWPVKPTRDTVVIAFLLYPDRPNAAVGKVIGDTKVAMPGAIAPVEAPHAAVQPGAALVEAKRTEAAEANLSPVDTATVGSVGGVVTDARTGLPVPEARVTVDSTELAASTDSTGRYVIESVPVGMHRLLVARAGFVNAYTVVRLVKDWAVTVNLYLRETASGSIPGK